MAKSLLVTAVDAGSARITTDSGNNKNDTFLGVEDGRKYTAFSSYTTSGSESAGTDIEFFRLPTDAILLEMTLSSTALGTSVTLQVGDSGDNDRYIAATSHASAATTAMSTSLPGSVGHKFIDNTDITVKTAGATLAGSQTIFLQCDFVMPGNTTFFQTQ